MTTLAWHDRLDQTEIARWIASAALVGLVHAGLIAGYLAWGAADATPGRPLEAISIDLAPVSAAPETQELDLAPGPTMQEAEPPAPEPERPEKIEETIAPTPPQEAPEVAAPPKEEPKPEPEKVEEPPKPVVKKKPKKPSKTPAPRTTAAPKAEQQAPARQARSGSAAAAAAMPSYRQRLAAHLQRFKRYPSEARSARAQGTVMAVFTVNRHGSVLRASISRSSGNAALDQEALAAIRRAQPLPSFPPEITQASLTFPVPFSFTLR